MKDLMPPGMTKAVIPQFLPRCRPLLLLCLAQTLLAILLVIMVETVVMMVPLMAMVVLKSQQTLSRGSCLGSPKRLQNLHIPMLQPTSLNLSQSPVQDKSLGA